MTSRPRILSAFTLATLILLGACAQSVGISPSAPKDGDATLPAEPTFSQFQDIPIPTGADMNMDRTLIFGAKETWIGRLVLTSSMNTAAMFDFFKARTPDFGWREITTVRSATSVMTYTRAKRVMTIQIRARTIRGTEVDITISPRENTGGNGAGQTITPAPVSPVRRGG